MPDWDDGAGAGMCGMRGAEPDQDSQPAHEAGRHGTDGVRHECSSLGRAGMMRGCGASESSGLLPGADWWTPRVRAGGRWIRTGFRGVRPLGERVGPHASRSGGKDLSRAEYFWIRSSGVSEEDIWVLHFQVPNVRNLRLESNPYRLLFT